MADYKDRLVAINEKINKLKQSEAKLIESRKGFFGDILERLSALTHCFAKFHQMKFYSSNTIYPIDFSCFSRFSARATLKWSKRTLTSY